jgi:NitT/TauT family transport system permease protein
VAFKTAILPARSVVGRNSLARRWRPDSRLVVVVGFVVVWEIVARLRIVESILLPSPTAVVWAGLSSFGAYMSALGVTAVEILVAATIASSLGVALGVLIGSSRLAMRIFGPLIDATFALPWVVFYPLAVVWFGIGSPSKILFAGAHAILPITLSTAAAVSIVDRRYVLLGRALGASRRQLYLKLLLPFALPQIMGGLRIGLGLVVIGVIVGEMLSSFAGLGYMISHARETLDAPNVYFGIVLGLLLAGGTNYAMSLVERRIGHWRA